MRNKHDSELSSSSARNRHQTAYKEGTDWQADGSVTDFYRSTPYSLITTDTNP